MAEEIVIFGGTFDPVHHGHLIVARAVLEELNLPTLTFLPTNVPPHKKPPAAGGEHRLEMLRLATAGEPRFAVSDLELRREGPSYTIDTVRRLRDELGDVGVRWVIGSDMLAELHKWRDIDRLLEEVRFVILERAGVSPTSREMLDAAASRLGSHFRGAPRRSIIPVPQIEISSSQVRRRIAIAEPIDWLVPESVARYIRSHRLYAPSGS